MLVTAALLGLLLRTRFLPVLLVAGMALLLGGGGLLLMLRSGASTQTVVLAAAGLLGLGAGGTVSPGLYLAAFSLPSKIVGRTFALVELVRSVADFILAPAAGGTVLYLLGRVGLPTPDIEAWIEKSRPAIRSPLLAETLRDTP